VGPQFPGVLGKQVKLHGADVDPVCRTLRIGVWETEEIVGYETAEPDVVGTASIEKESPTDVIKVQLDSGAGCGYRRRTPTYADPISGYRCPRLDKRFRFGRSFPLGCCQKQSHPPERQRERPRTQRRTRVGFQGWGLPDRQNTGWWGRPRTNPAPDWCALERATCPARSGNRQSGPG